MDKKALSRRSFLKFFSQLGLAGALGKFLRFFPEVEVALAQHEAWNPLGEISIQESTDMQGERKKNLIDQAINSVDGRNALSGGVSKLNLSEAKAVVHSLSDGNKLFAVAIPLADAQTVFASYIFEKPLLENKTNGGRLSSQAGIYTLEASKETIVLTSFSVNGTVVNLNDPNTIESDPCGGCIDFLNGPWSYYNSTCDSIDTNCAFGCCGGCVVPCGSGAVLPCLICVFVWCPICVGRCCTHVSGGCTDCGAP